MPPQAHIRSAIEGPPARSQTPQNEPSQQQPALHRNLFASTLSRRTTGTSSTMMANSSHNNDVNDVNTGSSTFLGSRAVNSLQLTSEDAASHEILIRDEHGNLPTVRPLLALYPDGNSSSSGGVGTIGVNDANAGAGYEGEGDYSGSAMRRGGRPDGEVDPTKLDDLDIKALELLRGHRSAGGHEVAELKAKVEKRLALMVAGLEGDRWMFEPEGQEGTRD